MLSIDALKDGDIRQTFDLLKSEVRRSPRDASLRTFLFQMFCVSGEWERALTQLAVVGELDPASTPMVRTYEVAVRCEILRSMVFKGQRTPSVLGKPGPWLPLLIEAARLLASGRPEHAAKLRDAAFEDAGASQAALNGVKSDWVADADPRLGPTVEATVNGTYVWIPYDRIRSIAFDPPQDLRDQVWTPATFTWTNGGIAVGLIPTRYPGTTDATDPALLLAHRTEFIETEHWSIPIGQRMLVTEASETALMDIRRLDLVHAAAPG